jgi:hypothetical protein
VFSTPYDASVDLSSLIGQKVKVKFRGTTGNANGLSSINPETGTLTVQLYINGIEEYIVSGEIKRYKIFVSSVAEIDAFQEGVTYTGDEVTGVQAYTGTFANINTIFLLPDSNTDLEKIEAADPTPELTEWNATADYTPGSIVATMDALSGVLNDKKNFKLWRSRSYISSAWSSGASYVADDIVLYRSAAGNPYVAYRALTSSTNENPATATTYWLPLLQQNGAPWPAYARGTRPSDLGTAWENLPAIAVQSELKEGESNNDWRPMIPETNVNTVTLDDERYYEWTFVPKVKPEVEFRSYQVRLDFRNNGFNRVNVPMAKNLRTIALY